MGSPDYRVDHLGAQFFGCGTNDLISTSFGINRDDARRFLAGDLDAGVFVVDPLTSLDVEGVGGLIQIAAPCKWAAHRT